MHVVGHDDEGIKLDILKTLWQTKPPFLDNSSIFRKHHLIVDDFAKQQRPILRANRDEIGTGLRIVVIAQPDGVTVARQTRAVHARDCTHRRGEAFARETQSTMAFAANASPYANRSPPDQRQICPRPLLRRTAPHAAERVVTAGRRARALRAEYR